MDKMELTYSGMSLVEHERAEAVGLLLDFGREIDSGNVRLGNYKLMAVEGRSPEAIRLVMV